MTERTVEDRLREEYFALLPGVQRVLEELKAEVQYCLLPLLKKLDRHEKVTVSSRIKDCESALGALRRRQEGAIFDPAQTSKYSLESLNDLAGVRVLAFPRSLWLETNRLLRHHPRFALWNSDPVRATSSNVGEEPLAYKYYGYCSENKAVRGEIQITPMLIGLFWEVEHSAIYKPSPQFKGVLAGMDEKTSEVYEVLKSFESEFERLIQRNPLKAKEKKKRRREEKRKKKKRQ